MYSALMGFNMYTFLTLQEETHPILFQHLEMCQPIYSHQPAVPHNAGTPSTITDAYLVQDHIITHIELNLFKL